MTEPARDVSPVLFETADGVATITFNRPESMNSLDVATKVALLDAVRRAADDAAVRCVVLTGTGTACGPSVCAANTSLSGSGVGTGVSVGSLAGDGPGHNRLDVPVTGS